MVRIHVAQMKNLLLFRPFDNVVGRGSGWLGFPCRRLLLLLQLLQWWWQ